MFKDIDDVPLEFLQEESEISYNYEGDFSPIKGLELIEKDLLLREDGTT